MQEREMVNELLCPFVVTLGDSQQNQITSFFLCFFEFHWGMAHILVISWSGGCTAHEVF